MTTKTFVRMQKGKQTVCSNSESPCQVQSPQCDHVVDPAVETLWFSFNTSSLTVALVTVQKGERTAELRISAPPVGVAHHNTRAD